MIKLLSSFCHLDRAQIAGEARSDELPIASAFDAAAVVLLLLTEEEGDEEEKMRW